MGHSSSADAEFVYVYGGYDPAAGTPAGFPDVYMFAHEACVWEAAAAPGIPAGRYDHAAWLAPGGLYVQGGKAGG
eukprot:9050127-Pyramimonas_sp.AAC.1